MAILSRPAKIEWQYPLPWSVSRALGATCKAAEAAGTPQAQKADRRTREYKATSARVLNNYLIIDTSLVMLDAYFEGKGRGLDLRDLIEN